MDDIRRRIQRMAVWTVTVFATVFSVTMTFFWMLVWPLSSTPLESIRLALMVGWPVFLAAAGLCATTFFLYRFFLKRKS
jgi:hypothetical protein